MSSIDVAALAKELRKRPLPMPNARRVEHGRAAIERLLPHRPPMLLVDAIHDIDLGARALRASLELRAGDPIFAGHFPGAPVYPGVLQVEAMGQAGLCLAHFLTRNTIDVDASATPAAVRALRILHAQYIEPLLPGDSVELYAAILDEDGMTATSAGQVVKSGRVASFSVQEVYFVE